MTMVSDGPDVEGVTVPRLRALRKMRLWTQRELARRADLTEVTVSHAENGKPVRFATARKLADALGIAPERLRDEAPEKVEAGA